MIVLPTISPFRLHLAPQPVDGRGVSSIGCLQDRAALRSGEAGWRAAEGGDARLARIRRNAGRVTVAVLELADVRAAEPDAREAIPANVNDAGILMTRGANLVSLSRTA
jgi:hypothetical protein